eukprot:8678889-Ditylum_brightwellii.AAC.1
MIWKCNHLTVKQRKDMVDLFQDYQDLFDGTIGRVPTKLISLTLKPNTKPFCSRPYTIPIAKVLGKGSNSSWGVPCLFQGKKDSRIRFLTDLRKLNEAILCSLYPLPNIDDVIWKMQGFTYATCLDLNQGYYHFAFDNFAQRLCSIILPWGKYHYKRLPQGLMVPSDIFQEHMDKVFEIFEDVLVYIDNIILYTKSTFDHHVKRLQAVLE